MLSLTHRYTRAYLLPANGWDGLQETLEEAKDKLRASEAETSSLSRAQEFLEGKVAELRQQLDEVRQGVTVVVGVFTHTPG